MAKPGSATAIGEAQHAWMTAAQRLADMPDMQRDLKQFVDMWPAIDAYTPPPEVAAMVSHIVHGMLATSNAVGPGDSTEKS